MHVSFFLSWLFVLFVLDLGLVSLELRFRAKNAHWIKTLYHSLLPIGILRGSRDEISDVQRFVRVSMKLGLLGR